jgi:hypothetical protein
VLQRLEPSRARVVILEQQPVSRRMPEDRLGDRPVVAGRPTSGCPDCRGTGGGRRSRPRGRPSAGYPTRRPDPAIPPRASPALRRTRASWARLWAAVAVTQLTRTILLTNSTSALVAVREGAASHAL